MESQTNGRRSGIGWQVGRRWPTAHSPTRMMEVFQTGNFWYIEITGSGMDLVQRLVPLKDVIPSTYPRRKVPEAEAEATCLHMISCNMSPEKNKHHSVASLRTMHVSPNFPFADAKQQESRSRIKKLQRSIQAC